MLFIDTYVHVKRYYSISIIRITQYPRNKIGPIERFEWEKRRIANVDSITHREDQSYTVKLRKTNISIYGFTLYDFIVVSGREPRAHLPQWHTEHGSSGRKWYIPTFDITRYHRTMSYCKQWIRSCRYVWIREGKRECVVVRLKTWSCKWGYIPAGFTVLICTDIWDVYVSITRFNALFHVGGCRAVLSLRNWEWWMSMYG